MLRKLLILTVMLPLGGCALLPLAGVGPRPDQAHLPLIHCDQAMEDPNYWIAKYVWRDQALLTLPQIEQLNRANYSRGFLIDIFAQTLGEGALYGPDHQGDENPGSNPERVSPLSREVLTAYTLYTFLKDETESLKSRNYCDEAGKPISHEIFKTWDDNLNLNAIHDLNSLRYGLTLCRTNLRYYPTDVLLATRPGKAQVDRLQVSALRSLEPLTILHSSRDNEWVFAVSAYCSGWIKRRDILDDCSLESIKNYCTPEKFLVVTGHAIEANSSPGNTATAVRLYMGTVCPLVQATDRGYTLAWPEKSGSEIVTQPMYVSATADVHVGFLECTPRNICLEAFKLLHTPYSWGGRGEYRDCSQMIMDVYATMGFKLPRNSGAQARVGSKRFIFNEDSTPEDRKTTLDALTAPALLQFPGHIMLYLGRVGENYYAIHDILSFCEPESPGKDRRMIIGQVVVSDLSLGEGSTRGTLLERLTNINLLQP